MKIRVINGPNINLLGSREPQIYGRKSYEALLDYMDRCAREYGLTVDVMQSNSEGALIDAVHESAGCYNGIVINPGAYTHYSYALLDALKAVAVPAVEVHLSPIGGREEFRRVSVVAEACVGQISGLGFYSYGAALRYFMEREKGGEECGEEDSAGQIGSEPC